MGTWLAGLLVDLIWTKNSCVFGVLGLLPKESELEVPTQARLLGWSFTESELMVARLRCVGSLVVICYENKNTFTSELLMLVRKCNKKHRKC
jgi:hypothetical protein